MKEWNIRVVKVFKDFGYIFILMVKIFKWWFEDLKLIDCYVLLCEDDLVRIVLIIVEVFFVFLKELYIRY